jgi:putative heme degradation protein
MHPNVVEQEVDVEILVVDFEVNLTSDESETHAEFEEELLDVIQESLLNLPFARLFADGEKIEDVWIFERLLSKVRLRRRKSESEVRDRLALALIQTALDLMDENSTTPTVLDGLPGVPEASGGVFNTLKQDDVLPPGDFTHKL